MGFKAKTTERKREREKFRQERFRLKQVRRQEAEERRFRKKELRRHMLKEHREGGGNGRAGEDPDIAGIVPGPQPLPKQWEIAWPQGNGR